MCKRAGLLIVVTSREMLDLPEEGDDDVYALEEAMDEFEKIEMKELLKDLREKFDLVPVRTIVKLHEQFGHPSREALVTSTRRQKQFLCQILISDANVVSVLEGLGALPLNWSYKAMPRSSRSELVCDGLRLLKNEGRLYISSRFTSRSSRNKANPCRFCWSPARRQSRWYITSTQGHRRLWKVNP